jgi:hypothetical protein
MDLELDRKKRPAEQVTLQVGERGEGQGITIDPATWSGKVRVNSVQRDGQRFGVEQ